MKLGPFTFGYNATEDRGHRTAPRTRVYHEGEVLTKYKRTKLTATTQDQIRNHSLVAWMVRKHLDYVSKFHFSFRTGKPDLDAIVNRIFRWHGAPRNIDFLGRFGRDEMFRLYELEKVVSGDAGLIKLEDLKLQALESDLICKGQGAPDGVNDSGLIVDSKGRVLSYCVCERGANGATPIFSHLEPRENIIFDGYWSRFSSQFRGVSPLSTAINTVADLHESFEYNLVKAKMHALFGVAIMRDAMGTSDMGGASGSSSARPWVAEAYTWAVSDYCTYSGKLYGCNAAHNTTSASVFATDLAAGYWTADVTQDALNLDPKTINILDLNPGEKVETIESDTPSSQFVEGSYLFIQIAMLALDIPITSFDSRRSSFSARIADLNEYEVSSDSKRTKNRYVRQEYSDWIIETIWNTSNEWALKDVALRNGMKMRDVQEAVEWIPSGSPWLDKYKQIQGDQLGIDIYLDNPIDACRRRGGDVFANIDKIAEVRAYAEAAGIPPPVQSGATPAAVVEDDEADQEPEADEPDEGADDE